jgi:hypothetical protein
MICRDLRLKPHPSSEPPPPLEITARLLRSSCTVSMSLQVRGSPDLIVIPARAASPARRTGLWEQTCFELFLAPERSSRYWEVNLSPSGHWNVFRFSGYRQDMQEETALTSLPFTVQMEPRVMLVNLDVEITEIGERNLAAGVSAVIESRGGHRTYWSLLHCGPRPDFHAREGFVVDLPLGETGPDHR